MAKRKRRTFTPEFKTEVVLEALCGESSQAELVFLPPYSPDYNPIEHDFANIKRKRE